MLTDSVNMEHMKNANVPNGANCVQGNKKQSKNEVHKDIMGAECNLLWHIMLLHCREWPYMVLCALVRPFMVLGGLA